MIHSISEDDSEEKATYMSQLREPWNGVEWGGHRPFIYRRLHMSAAESYMPEPVVSFSSVKEMYRFLY